VENAPSFGPTLFVADAVDLHAARVELPFGGSGVFNHSEPQLSFLVQGRSWIEAAGVGAWIEPGTLVMLPAGPRRNVVSPGTVCYSVGLGESQPRGQTSVTPVIAVVRGAAFRRWRERMESLCERPSTSREELNAAFTPMVTAAIERRARHRDELIRSFFDIVEASLDRAMTLRELGDRLGYAPNHLGELVRIHTGRSIRQWQILLRMEAARRALRDTIRPVGAIAESLGFEPAFFARTFRRHYHHSATQWRRAVTASSNIPDAAANLTAQGIVRIQA